LEKGEYMATMDSRAAALHRHLDTQIENLERKNYHNRELITDLKKQKLKIKDRLHTLSIREAKRSKKETQTRYKNIQLELFNKGNQKGNVT
jgi:uncharacterized protein YdcH (DUF465 family)|tara:strand:- start:93 stop:365 length:273 start_codon:yes stop_codon:yes gene_type:complete